MLSSSVSNVPLALGLKSTLDESMKRTRAARAALGQKDRNRQSCQPAMLADCYHKKYHILQC